VQLERAAKFIKNFERKERDLSLVIIFEIEIAITANPATGHAFDHRDFDRRIIARFASVMSNKIVTGRNVKMADFHRPMITSRRAFHMKENGIDSQKIIRRNRDGELEYQPDDLTIEEPLEIRIGRKALATTMRTPGHDEELAAGFLVSEAIVRKRGEVAKISRNGDNVVTVELTAGVRPQLNSAKRFGTISSSCGLCGKNSVEAIRQNFPPIQARGIRVEIETLLSLPELLRKQQSDFTRTGGIHAAAVFDLHRHPQIVREDIGRHNAVDKAIGRAFLDGLLPLDRHLLLVSGRASFEIMQKALSAGIPIVASVSAPSTLAVSFARESKQTLIGFLRPPSFNIYSHIERVILEVRHPA
jgi:FdhD protein